MRGSFTTFRMTAYVRARCASLSSMDGRFMTIITGILLANEILDQEGVRYSANRCLRLSRWCSCT
jgi:hypothetical protein